MANKNNVIGKIDSIQGSGDALIIRASGEQVVAQPGMTIFTGDRVIAGTGASVLISTADTGNFGSSGVLFINSAHAAKFDNVLLENIAAEVASSSEENPIDVGVKPINEVVERFNGILPESAIETADESSQSNRVADINLEEEFDPTSAGGDLDNSLRDGNLVSFVERGNEEELPDAGVDTGAFEGPIDTEHPEKIPGSDIETDNGDFPEQKPTGDTSIKTEENEGDDNEPLETTLVTETIILPASAIDDDVTTREDTTLNINVLSNDLNADGATISLPNSTSVNGARLTINGDTISYDPPANFNGTDTFSYTVTNGGTSSTGTVTVNVTSVVDNALPSAVDGSATIAEDSSYVFSAATDFAFSDSDADAFADIRIDTLPVLGNLTLNGLPVSVGDFISVANINAGLLVFTPVANGNGSSYAAFEFSVRDSAGSVSATSNTFTLNVTEDNNDPVNDTNTIAEDTTLTVNASSGVLSNDESNNTSVATYSIAGGASGIAAGSGAQTLPGGAGTIELNADGSYEYVPAADFHGAVPVITYTTNTGQTATLTLTATLVNDNPINTVPALVVTDIDTPFSFTGSGNTVSSADPDTTAPREITTVQLTVTDGTITATTGGGIRICIRRESWVYHVYLIWHRSRNTGIDGHVTVYAYRCLYR
ncbi:hypothetical protein AB835_00845 [Candidatus Endobugula sertula]|uniref:RapA2 cadherin-like domain-containing protein n=1 Tax=Candidatus Endobugula sertula TaxID=62101 RepID=A0A1D2QTF0_9GAMM|nr:hypothetical protein AB835_00845 [Candidatus Endobugula sertula]